MQRYYALITDGTLQNIGWFEDHEEASRAAPLNSLWIINDEDAEQWRETLNGLVRPRITMAAEGERPAFKELQPMVCNNTLAQAFSDAIEIKEAANPVSMGVQNASMTLAPPSEDATPSVWRIYLRGHSLCTSCEALHPAVAVEQARANHIGSGLIRDSRDYLAIRDKGEKLNSYLIEYDAAPEAMGQGATVEAYNATEACRIARWIFLIPEALDVTVRRLDK